MWLYEPPPRPVWTQDRCTSELGQVLTTHEKVKTLLGAINTLNGRVLRRGITCRPCQGTVQAHRMGYYDGTYQRIVLCCDNIRSREDLEDTLIHELVHAFDAARSGKFTSICHLIACGEVRASAMGQCADVQPDHQRRQCIWRDAVQSTQVHCGEQAARIVKQVFETCMQDTAPL
ncbi:peptidase M76 [Gongronella butleri]|nr:peptidase M76 [Gongronella butleri]